jgi:hypothetical protein
MQLKANKGNTTGGVSQAYGNDLEQIQEYRVNTGNN